MNETIQTVCSQYDGSSVCFSSRDHPFYHSAQPTLIDGIPDPILTLAGPILAYWSSSLFFHSLDISDWKWLEKYRIHESAETQTRNLVSRTQVIWAVIFQQVVQTVLGLFWLSDHYDGDHVLAMHRIARFLAPILFRLVGREWEGKLLHSLAYSIYWWVIPSAQLLFAMYVY